ncbi:NucA/NucB deoxyribonuclease domain-containing protein [Paenibacillus lacisoli]
MLYLIVLVLGVLWLYHYHPEIIKDPKAILDQKADVTITFPIAKYPQTGQHIREAIDAGASSVCTIDRKGAAANRELSLKHVKVKKGYDRDEWPMAMCAEGGTGADVKYISPKDNRGAGSWVSHKLESYPDGTKVKFVVQ